MTIQAQTPVALLKRLFFGINQLIALFAAVAGILLSFTLLHWTEHRYLEALDRIGDERLELYASTVQSAHKRFNYLPFIVAGDHQVIALLQGKGSKESTSQKLEAWQKASDASVLYLMSRQGTVLASSNWRMRESFVGKDYHFRPYFTDALDGRQGQFFAVGVTTGQPGLFLSRPVIVDDEVIGVAVVKIDMTPLEDNWASGGENVLIADQDDIIFLASRPEWKYKSLKPLNEETFKRLSAGKKYSTNIITPLSIHNQSHASIGKDIIYISRTSHTIESEQNAPGFLVHNRLIKELNWTLYYLTSLEELSDKKREAIIVSMLTATLMALIGFILANRINNRQLLEKRVTSRTKALNDINSRLLDEINEHVKTEDQLHQTHEELIQAEKLAVLGQMSAGLVHEINQPLSAMQTFTASTRLLLERNETNSALENIKDIESMIRRVTTIVSHLKSFATKSKGVTTCVALNEVIENALLLLNPRISKSEITLDWKKPETPIYVKADEVKLEQILINLIRNALDAMQKDGTSNTHQLTIELESMDKMVNLYIKDTGCGINSEDLPKIFDPFFTTKEPGEGLGLGLSISYGIAHEFGGELEAVNRSPRGMVFKLSINAIEASGEANDQ